MMGTSLCIVTKWLACCRWRLNNGPSQIVHSLTTHVPQNAFSSRLTSPARRAILILHQLPALSNRTIRPPRRPI
jgi:hypothetical protein